MVREDEQSQSQRRAIEEACYQELRTKHGNPFEHWTAMPTIADYIKTVTEVPQLLFYYATLNDDQLEEQLGEGYRAYVDAAYKAAWFEFAHQTNWLTRG